MGIEEFLKRDTSYKVQPIPKSTGFFDGIVRGALILSEAKKKKKKIEIREKLMKKELFMMKFQIYKYTEML